MNDMLLEILIRGIFIVIMFYCIKYYHDKKSKKNFEESVKFREQFKRAEPLYTKVNHCHNGCKHPPEYECQEYICNTCNDILKVTNIDRKEAKDWKCPKCMATAIYVYYKCEKCNYSLSLVKQIHKDHTK